MKLNRFFLVSAALSLVACLVQAETDYKALAVIKDIQQGKATKNAIVDLYVTDDIAVLDDLGVGDDLAVTGKVDVSEDVWVVDDIGVGDDLAVTGTVTVTEEVVVDGKYAAVGPDATTGLMIQTGSGTFEADGLQTSAFTVAYGAAPFAFGAYSNNLQTGTNIAFVSSTTAAAVFHGEPSVDYIYHAVGARP